MNRAIHAVVFTGVILAPLSVHGAETVKGAVMTHQGANMQAGQQLTKEKPSSSPDASGMMMHSVPSSMKPQQAPVTIKETKVPSQSSPQPSIEPDVVNVPPPAMKQPAPTAAVQPRPADQAGQAAMVPRDTGLDNLAAIRDAQQARMFEEARQAADALRELANVESLGDGVNPDLGLGGSKDGVDLSKLPGHDVAGYEMPDGSLSMPELPSNQKGRTGQASASLRPSTNPRDWAGGIAGQDAGGGSGGLVDWDGQPRRGGDGSDLMVDWDGNPRGGTTRPGNASESASRPLATLQDWEAEGRDRAIIQEKKEEAAQNIIDKKNEAVGGGGLNESHDMETAGARSGGCVEVGGQDCTVEGPRSPDRVRPGPDSMQQTSEAARLAFSREQLVINPSPENSGQSRELSEEQARAMSQQLRQKVQGPGGHPGDSPESALLESSAPGAQAQ